jgi:diguanylate cyclase (GGDEF)-like protein
MKDSGQAQVEGQRILLIGDIRKAFLDADSVAGAGCDVCQNVAAGIDAAAKRKYSVIGLVIQSTAGRSRSVLEELREVCRGGPSGTRIILLSQIYEEPAAIELVSGTDGEEGPADEYMICPARFFEFVRCAGHLGGVVAEDLGVKSARDGQVVQLGEQTGLRRRIELLEKLATEDDLTGLKNRRYIWEFGRQVIERAKGNGGRVTLLVFDVDNLKQYNDTYGHIAGDGVLRQAGALMRRCCRGHDVVGRIGGDEFAVIFWDEPRLQDEAGRSDRRSAGAEHPTEAIAIAKRFVKELEESEHDGLGRAGGGVLTISGGLASFPRDGSTIDELFARADAALLDAKRSGKNRIYLVGRPSGDIADMG